MDSIIQMLVPLIIVILSVVLGNSRRRKAQQQNVERRAEENTLAEANDDAAPPPFMEDFPFATEFEQMMTQEDADEDETEAVPEAPEEPEPPAPQEPAQPDRSQRPPPIPVESPAKIRSVPVTSLLNFSPQAFRQGIILKEILERPRSRRNSRNR